MSDEKEKDVINGLPGNPYTEKDVETAWTKLMDAAGGDLNNAVDVNKLDLTIGELNVFLHFEYDQQNGGRLTH